MTELEALALELENKITQEWYTRTGRIYPDLFTALQSAYQLGRALTPAQLAARKRNAQKAGRKAGSRDSQPRTRRTRAELEAAKMEMKP